jgi:polysaccharide pyruvyl transferase WcaK-like protein
VTFDHGEDRGTMASETRFLLVGNGSNENRGCEAILRGTTAVLRRRFGSCRFTVCNLGSFEAAERDRHQEADPAVEHRPLGLREEELRHRLRRRLPARARRFVTRWQYHYDRLLAPLADAACALEIGGDNYSLDYSLPLAFLRIDRRILKAGKPLVLFGASVGPFSARPMLERRMRRHLRRFTQICARETETVRYLASLGIERNVVLTTDPAFALEPKRPDLPDPLMRVLERRPVGLNLSPTVARFIPTTRAGWRELAAGCVEAVLARGADEVLLIPHVMKPGNNDHDLLSAVVAALPQHGERIAVLPGTLSAAEYKWAISQCRAFAGARTHCTIAALSSHVPTLMVGYSMKARGLAHDVYGTDEWLLRAADVQPDAFGDRMADLLAREAEVRAHLDECMPAYIERAFSAADHVARILPRGDGGLNA